jgi:hypothetical protein
MTTELIQLTHQPKPGGEATANSVVHTAASGTRVVAVVTFTILDVATWQKPLFFLSPKNLIACELN